MTKIKTHGDARSITCDSLFTGVTEHLVFWETQKMFVMARRLSKKTTAFIKDNADEIFKNRVDRMTNALSFSEQAANIQGEEQGLCRASPKSIYEPDPVSDLKFKTIFCFPEMP